jgi:cytochrome c biogenesis protein CcmG, thiol:disulfide interchange protein DsbE
VKKNQSKARGRPLSRLMPLVLLGSGLILLGVAAFIVLSFPAAGGAANSLPANVPVQMDFPAPDLRLADLQGNPVSLDEKRGQVVLINNWATWCPPCREEMPTLEAYYQKHQDKGFVVVAIDAGEPAKDVIEFVDRLGLTFPVWLDPNQEALRAFRNNALPSSYIVDRQGTVRMAWSGKVTMQALEDHVTPLLEE